MISLEIQGLEETIAAIRDVPTVLDREKAFSEVASQFKDRLIEVTPVGYSGRLKRSVIAEVEADEARVGYESGVETAGNPKLDSVLRVRTRGRSVLWVPVDDLEETLAQEFEDFEGVAMSVLEASFAESLANAST
jgi:hypothetical protein